jgi:hypothetical protein
LAAGSGTPGAGCTGERVSSSCSGASIIDGIAGSNNKAVLTPEQKAQGYTSLYSGAPDLPLGDGGSSFAYTLIPAGTALKLLSSGSQLVVRAVYVGSAKLLAPSSKVLLKLGVPEQKVAQAVVSARNELKVGARYFTSAENVAQFEARNLVKYGDKIGPIAEQLFDKYGSWAKVIEAASRTAGLIP